MSKWQFEFGPYYKPMRQLWQRAILGPISLNLAKWEMQGWVTNLVGKTAMWAMAGDAIY